MTRAPSVSIVPRFRIYRGDDIAMGPGKARLLKAIASTGSISGAAKHLAMSYARAWNLVGTMNDCFKSPLVLTERGGSQRGGACLSPLGEAVLAAYRAMETRATKAAARDAASIRRHLA